MNRYTTESIEDFTNTDTPKYTDIFIISSLLLLFKSLIIVSFILKEPIWN